VTRFNDVSSPLSLLATRRSARARDLVAPGPSPEQLDHILELAMRVPDHGKLAPFAFVHIADRDAFARLIVDGWRAERPDSGRLEVEALDSFARQAPTLVALLSTPRDSHIPLWEQQMSAGAAAFALLMAAHAHGFAGNWLTGPAAYLPGLPQALGHEGASVVGYFFLGTPSQPLEERPRPDPRALVSRWPGR
jgi:nitroreductase